MKRFLIVIFSLIITFQISFAQPIQKSNNHPFSGSFVVSLLGGASIATTDYESFRPDYQGMGFIEYFFKINSKHALGLKLFGGLGNLSGSDNTLVPDRFQTNYLQGGGGLTYSYFIDTKFIPYLSAGISNLWFTPKDGNGVEIPYGTPTGKSSSLFYNFQIGMHSYLSDHFTLNANLGFNIGETDLLEGLIKTGTTNDKFYNLSLGFSYAFFSSVDTDTDRDADGVPDINDKCIGTPPGVRVTADGCPLDSDGDGIADYLDRCPETPKGVFADLNGCPVDTDSDGIADYLDKCPGTALGTNVDPNGCPLSQTENTKDQMPVYIPPKEETQKQDTYKTYKPYDPTNEYEIKKNIWTDSNQYVIQVSSWKTRVKAERIERDWRAKGHNSFVQQSYVKKFGRTYYRVRIGYFNSIEEAEAYQRNLR